MKGTRTLCDKCGNYHSARRACVPEPESPALPIMRRGPVKPTAKMIRRAEEARRRTMH